MTSPPSIAATFAPSRQLSSPRERLEKASERVVSRERGTELLVVLLRHAVEPVEALRRPTARLRASVAADATSSGSKRGAGERVRAAAGPADDVEPLEPERVGERGDVARRSRRPIVLAFASSRRSPAAST